MIRFLTIIALLFSTNSFAKKGSFSSYGVGVFDKNSSTADVKLFSIGYQDEWLWFLDQKYEGGLWADTRRDIGRSSSGYIAYSIGTEASRDWFYIHSFWGLALITHTDSKLSTPYQFMQDLGLGFEGDNKVRIGLNYKHISNAGIKEPNRGRDFLQIKIQIPY